MSFLRDMVTRVWGEPVEGMQAAVIVDPDDATRIMHVNSDGSLTVGGTVTSSGSVTVANGADVTQGNTTDAAVVGDNPGTLSAKLRGLTKIYNDTWDSVNHRLHVNVDNANSNGQATMANSSPVVIASDQSTLPTKTELFGYLRSGNTFIATNPNNSVTATNNFLTVCGLSIFNASTSGKNVLIYSIQASCAGGNTISSLRATTTDPSGTTGFTGTASSSNLKLDGSGPSSSLCCSPSGITTSPSAPGSLIANYGIAGNAFQEILTNGTGILLPQGTAHGIAVMLFVVTAAQNFQCTVRWIEY